MSIQINCPNCHENSSLKFLTLSPKASVGTLSDSTEEISPAVEPSSFSIDGPMVAPPLHLPPGWKGPRNMAMHNYGGYLPGLLMNTNHNDHLHPHGQVQQFPWQMYGIPTGHKGGPKYAIHMAVKYAYDKGYKDARKYGVSGHSFKKVVGEAERLESAELQDRLFRENRGKLTMTEIRDLTANEARQLLETAEKNSQKGKGGHKGRRDHVRRNKSRARSRRPQTARRSQNNREDHLADMLNRMRMGSEYSSSTESDYEE